LNTNVHLLSVFKVYLRQKIQKVHRAENEKQDASMLIFWKSVNLLLMDHQY